MKQQDIDSRMDVATVGNVTMKKKFRTRRKIKLPLTILKIADGRKYLFTIECLGKGQRTQISSHRMSDT